MLCMIGLSTLAGLAYDLSGGLRPRLPAAPNLSPRVVVAGDVAEDAGQRTAPLTELLPAVGFQLLLKLLVSDDYCHVSPWITCVPANPTLSSAVVQRKMNH
jgi:hypothetical protein